MLAGLYLVVAYLLLPDLWMRREDEPGLAGRPMVTLTADHIPGDPMNLRLVGSRAEVADAMAAAGWSPADPVTLRSSLEIAGSVVFDRPYPDAPVSPLFYDGREEDLAFEKPDGTSADRRHHVRLWLVLQAGRAGRPVWLGSASFDQSAGFSHDTGQITHHIAPDIDAERDLLIADLTAAGWIEESHRAPGIGATMSGRNGGGDRYFTDGEVAVGVLRVAASR
jgi:hypothetical protein